MIDKNGNLLEKFQQVEVGEPNRTDMHQHSFMGTVIDVLDSRGTAIVEDQCGEAFEVDVDNVVITD